MLATLLTTLAMIVVVATFCAWMMRSTPRSPRVVWSPVGRRTDWFPLASNVTARVLMHHPPHHRNPGRWSIDERTRVTPADPMVPRYLREKSVTGKMGSEVASQEADVLRALVL